MENGKSHHPNVAFPLLLRSFAGTKFVSVALINSLGSKSSRTHELNLRPQKHYIAVLRFPRKNRERFIAVVISIRFVILSQHGHFVRPVHMNGVLLTSLPVELE